VVGIDVHVSNAFQAVIPPQHFHGDAAVVEHAEPGGGVARGVVEPRDRDERAARAAGHDLVGRGQRRTDDVRRGLENAAPGRRIARIEVALAGARGFLDPVDVLRGVEGFEFVARGRARFHHADALVEAARREFGEKRRMAIGTERMAVAESVTREAFARDQQDRLGHSLPCIWPRQT
jgi:hypothetical protein